MNRITSLLACFVIAACGEPSLVDTLSTTESELQTAQCTQAGANGCLASFQSCTQDAATCQAQLRSCLPPPPDRQRPDGGACGADGGRGGHPPRGPGGPGRGPGGRPPLSETCRTALDACLDAGPADPRTCFEDAHTCMRAEFQARCDEAATQCASSEDEVCARILERCNVGVDAIPTGTVCE